MPHVAGCLKGTLQSLLYGYSTRDKPEIMKKHEIITSCAAGLEELVENEIQQFGGTSIECAKGMVSWQGDLESAYRCCLWSRFASRVFLQLSQFEVNNEEALYTKCLAIEWQNYFDEETSFAVNCTISAGSPINHNKYAALKVKDAIVDGFRDRTGRRPSVSTKKPGFQVHLHLEGEKATLALDMTGEALHRRGYRGSAGRAPLKENLGAAIVALGGWTDEEGGCFVDPMCGTGTLLIEAAFMFGDIAPGLFRYYYGFLGWKDHDDELWRKLIFEAEERKENGLQKKWPLIQGYDCDPVAVSSARKNVELSGLTEYIQIKQAELATLNPPAGSGLVISNLPYGERLSETVLVAQLYAAYGRIIRQKFHGWRTGAFIANPELTDSFGLTWQEKHKLHNGSIPCRLLISTVIEDTSSVFQWQPGAAQKEEQEDAFGNRLRKNLKKTLKWAKREGIFCFRVYDRDLPDYNISVDLYEKWVHIHEYAPPKTIDPAVASARLRSAIKIVRDILGVRSDRVFVKKRERQRGKNQYEKRGSQKKMYTVREGACHYLVNFRDYLDTGLFLDHRPVRKKIFQAARGKRFLNLFGYTGTASVQAALGGAASTTTVDLSATYLHWARMNFALNGLAEKNHRTEQMDCIKWLHSNVSVYDLILLDPPTFSNTKKEGLVFDVQKDHIELIHSAMSRLSSEGLLLFSTNYRQFKLEKDIEEQYDVVNITQQTIPFDYSRNKRIHMCWEIRKKQ